MAQIASSAQASPERVLIVDDHSLVRDGLRSIFIDAFPACTILEADGLEAALRTLTDQGNVDLVLLDLNIPDVSHLSGLEALRDGFPATPVVMVSGVTDRKTVRDALAAGAAGSAAGAAGTAGATGAQPASTANKASRDTMRTTAFIVSNLL